MSTLAYQKPFIAKVERAPATSISQTLTQSAVRSPMAGMLKPIPSMNVKPHVPPIRQNFVRNSGDNAIKLPKLQTPGRNRSVSNTVDFFSPVRQNIAGVALSVRNQGPKAIITEAKLITIQPNITGPAMRNKTALELSRFIDKRLTDVAKSNIKYNRQNGDDSIDPMNLADDQQGRMLRARLFNRAGRKEVISNKTNFRDIENPFADHSMTLQTIKKEKHEAWKVRKHEKSLKLKSQIADMERKLHIYRIYKDELGVSLSKSERENVLNRFDSTGVELLMGRKMFTIRQTQAAIRIQAWWRKQKSFTWYRLISRIRMLAAVKIQRSWTVFRQNRLMPEQNRHARVSAAIRIQSAWRGYTVRKRFIDEMSIMRMERNFRYFDKIQYDLQKGAILFIIRHWKKFVIRRKNEREQQKQLGNSETNKKKGGKPTSTTSKQAPASTGKRGSISKVSRQTASSQKTSSAASNQNTVNAKKSTGSQKGTADQVFTTGLKKGGESENGKKSNPSLAKEKSQESLKKSSAQDRASVRPEDAITPDADKINVKDSAVVQSQDELRLNTTSPLETQAPVDSALLTQEIKAAFPDEGGVIHEVEEENQPDDRSEGQRVSFLRNDKAGSLNKSQGDADDNIGATKENFLTDQRIKHAAADQESLAQASGAGETVAQRFPRQLEEQEEVKRVEIGMGSTGEVSATGSQAAGRGKKPQRSDSKAAIQVQENGKASPELTKQRQAEQQELIDEIYQEFCGLDSDGSGQLEYDEIIKFIDAMCLRSPDDFDREVLLARVMDVDVNRDGKLSWPEFKNMVFGTPSKQQRQQEQESPQQNQMSFQGSQPDLSLGQQNIGRNLSQEQLSLGVNDQPVSRSVIPGKLDEEQSARMRSQKNGPAQGGDDAGNVRGSINSPVLRSSEKSAKMKLVQRSQETGGLRSNNINKSKDSMQKNKQMDDQNSFKVANSSRRSNKKDSSAQLPVQAHQSLQGSLKSNKSGAQAGAGNKPNRSSAAKGATSQKSLLKQNSHQVLQQQETPEASQKAQRRESNASRQSVREMAQQRRPSQLENNDEKGDKFSAYEDSEREAHYGQMQRMSFENVQIKDVAAEEQARKEELHQQSDRDQDSPGADNAEQAANDNQFASSNGMKKDEKGENKGRYDDDDDDYFS